MLFPTLSIKKVILNKAKTIFQCQVNFVAQFESNTSTYSSGRFERFVKKTWTTITLANAHSRRDSRNGMAL